MKSKKILALVLSMLMILAAFPLASFAAADDAAPIARYNFGPSGSAQKENWTMVNEGTVYTSTLGYGLKDAMSSSEGRDRGSIDGLYYDPMTASWLGNTDWSFYVDLPNGTYDVVIFCADMNSDTSSNMSKATKNGIRVTAEDVQYDYMHIQTSKLPKVDGETQPYFVTYPVTVADGQLSLRFGGLTAEEQQEVLSQINVYDPEFDVTYSWSKAVQGYVNGIAIYNQGKAPTALADLLSASGTATVVPQTYDITVNGGTANLAKAEEGTPITVTADVPSGKQFVSWTVNAGTVTPTGGTSLTSETLTFNMPAEAVSLTANFEDIPAPPVGEITVSSDKELYGTNQDIVVTITTPDTVKKAYLVNESGTGLAASREVIENDNGTITWILTFALGTNGNRTLTVYTDGAATDKTVSFKVDNSVPAEVGEAKIISASIDETGKVNQTITATIQTSTSVAKVRLFNESGTGLAPSKCTYVDDGDVRTWTYEMSVGSIGARTFIVKVAGTDMVWADETAELSTLITR